MLSEKWRERAGQRTSLAQGNADLSGRLERANDRNQQQQQTIEHLQVAHILPNTIWSPNDTIAKHVAHATIAEGLIFCRSRSLSRTNPLCLAIDGDL